MFLWIFLGVVVLIIAVAFVMGLRQGGRLAAHAAAVRDLASQNGWAYTERSETAAVLCRRLPAAHGQPHHMIQDSLYRSKEVTRTPVRLDARDVVAARVDGRDVLFFNLTAVHLSHQNDKVGVSHRHTVWAVELPTISGWVQAATKNQWFDKWMGTWYSTEDTAFDERFRVTADDGAPVRQYVTPEVRRLLFDSGFDGWRLDPDNQHLLAWTYKRHPEPARIVDMARAAVKLAAAVSRTTAA